MTNLLFTAEKEFTHNFKTIINGSPVTIVVAEGDKFTKGEIVELEAKKRSTGDGFYLIRASKLEDIKLKEVTVDTKKITDNKIDISKIVL